MLRDDETLLYPPAEPIFPLEVQPFGGGEYLLLVPAAQPELLGGRLLAIDGQPVGRVLARIMPYIDYQDAEYGRQAALADLDNATVLRWLGITRSPAAARFTVQTRAGRRVTVRLTARGHASVGVPDLLTVPGLDDVHVPLPLYLQHGTSPYWLQVLPAQDAVYLKYNECLDNNGFQRLAARALAILAQHPGYRLIVDLRGNLGGDSTPFQALISGIRADPAIDRPGRVIGLVDHFTDSSATIDAQSLSQETRAVLIGEDPLDPLDGYGNDMTFQLPASGFTVQYTTVILNPKRIPWGIPAVRIAPSLSQVLAGEDPVLAAALAYHA